MGLENPGDRMVILCMHPVVGEGLCGRVLFPVDVRFSSL